MAESELAAVFDMLKVTLAKSEPVHDKAEALNSLVQVAVQRGLEAHDLAGDATEITKTVLVTLRYMAGGLIVHGSLSTASGLVMRPYQSVSKKFSKIRQSEQSGRSAESDLTDSAASPQGLSGKGTSSSQHTSSVAPDQARLAVVNATLAELGMPEIQGRADVTKMAAASVRNLCTTLQLVIDRDAITGAEVDFLNDYVADNGVFKHSGSGQPTAADFKDGLKRWLFEV